MKKTKILVIHGFNSGPGLKNEIIAQAFPGCEVVCPQLTGHPKQDEGILFNVLNSYESYDRHIIVGTSLGGFYAMYLASYVCNSQIDLNLSLYLINPSFSPHETLYKYKEQKLINYKTGLESEPLLDFDFSEFEKMKVFISKYFGSIANTDMPVNVFIGTQDEVLDFTEFLKFIEEVGVESHVYFESQDHHFADIKNVVESIKQLK